MKTFPTNIRLTEEMNSRLDEIAAKTGQIKADVIRDAIELGLDDLALVEKSELQRLKDEVAAAKAAQQAISVPIRPLRQSRTINPNR